MSSIHLDVLSHVLSIVQFATDFYKALVNITSGIMLPLTTADLLAHAIVGLVLENLDMERLVREVGQAVAQRILGNNESVDDVARELHEKLLLRNESTKKVVIESIYRDSDEARHNVEVFSGAANLAEARPHLRKVCSSQTPYSFSSTDTDHIHTHPFFFSLSLTSDCVDQWDPFHRQVHASADAEREGFLRLPAVLPPAPVGISTSPHGVALHAGVTTAQGSHRLCGVRYVKDVGCVWHCRPVDPVLPGGQQGGVWEHAGDRAKHHRRRRRRRR